MLEQRNNACPVGTRQLTEIVRGVLGYCAQHPVGDSGSIAYAIFHHFVLVGEM